MLTTTGDGWRNTCCPGRFDRNTLGWLRAGRGQPLCFFLGVYWAHSTGQLDSWFAQAQLNDKPFTEISCRDLGKVAKGQSLRNAFGASSRVLDVISVRQVSRHMSQVTCSAKVLLSDGQRATLRIKVSDFKGEKLYEFSTR
jgi:hypothetical protein